MAIVLCGLRAENFPSDIGITVLHNFIREMYPDYTAYEIAFAFKMAMTRRLPGLDNPSCFENFSCEYVGRILSAYEKWDSMPKANSRFAQALQGMIDERAHENWRGEAQAWYERFIAREHIDFIPANIYFILVYDRIIDPIPQRREYPKFLRVMVHFEHAADNSLPYLYTKHVQNERPTRVDASTTFEQELRDSCENVLHIWKMRIKEIRKSEKRTPQTRSNSVGSSPM